MASDSHQEGRISACLSSSLLQRCLPWQHMFILARLWRQCDSGVFCPRVANGSAIDALLTLMAVTDYYHGFILQLHFSGWRSWVLYTSISVSLCAHSLAVGTQLCLKHADGQLSSIYLWCAFCRWQLIWGSHRDTSPYKCDF